jgi:hypothetical protein
MGPPIAPLDFASVIVSPDQTHSSLAKTVSDLTQWLAVVENGLARVLEPIGEDEIIEEEQEFMFGASRGSEERDAFTIPPPVTTFSAT